MVCKENEDHLSIRPRKQGPKEEVCMEELLALSGKEQTGLWAFNSS